jgi:SAM-dependent methyltransferase
MLKAPSELHLPSARTQGPTIRRWEVWSLQGLTVKDALTPRPEWIPGGRPALRADEPIESALASMRKARFGRQPVEMDGELVGITTQSDLERVRRMAEVDFRISPRDRMFDGSLPAYLRVGESALECIRAVLGERPVGSVLDFPCGHGRVLRVLRHAFPDARLAACDIDRDGVEFCRRLGAEGFVSDEDPEQISIPGGFDLIWCGSLLTHLDAPRWSGFLRLFASLLSRDGVLVFTTHGRYVAERMAGGDTYGLPDTTDVRDSYARTGFGYADYSNYDGYGISVSSPAWVRGLLGRLGLELIGFEERAWVDAHDVVAVVAQTSRSGSISRT